ncbi:MAG: sigma factor, partial [Acidimicrobiia bacterium]
MTGFDADQVDRVFRQESGKAIATLVRLCGDIGVAEEAVQEAFVAALEKWPTSGVPPSPAGCIITTARNGAID